MCLKKYMKNIIAIVSFLAAIVIGFIAMFLPPSGVIDTSVLWFIAQLLVFTSNIFGFNLDVFKPNADLQSSKKN